MGSAANLENLRGGSQFNGLSKDGEDKEKLQAAILGPFQFGKQFNVNDLKADIPDAREGDGLGDKVEDTTVTTQIKITSARNNKG